MVREVNKYILSVLGVGVFFYAVVFSIGISPYLAGFLFLTGVTLAIGYVSIQFYKGFQEPVS